MIEKVGKMTVVDEHITVTDPCYDDGSWGIIHTKMLPGTYRCYAASGTSLCWGNRCWGIRIIRENDNGKMPEIGCADWRIIGYIGVDAGLAGFFQDKPNFTDEEWKVFCGELNLRENTYLKKVGGKDGFFSESGSGDGRYPVYAATDKAGNQIGLKISFN